MLFRLNSLLFVYFYRRSFSSGLPINGPLVPVSGMSHGDHTNPFEEESENVPLLSAPSDPAHNYSDPNAPSGREVGQEERVVDSGQRTYQGTTETYQAESSQSGEGAPSISHGHGGTSQRDA